MKRRNDLNVIERAHLRTNQELYNENYDRIFGTKDKPLYAETSNEEKEPGEREVSQLQVSEDTQGS